METAVSSDLHHPICEAAQDKRALRLFEPTIPKILGPPACGCSDPPRASISNGMDVTHAEPAMRAEIFLGRAA